MSIMNKIGLVLCCVLASCATKAPHDDTGSVVVKGTITGDVPEYVMIYSEGIADNVGFDTIRLNGSATFEKKYTLKEAAPGYVVLPDAGAATVYLEDGITTGIIAELAMNDEGTTEIKSLVYEGDNGDCARFIDDMQQWQYCANWPFERLDTTKFADYRRLYLAEVDSVYASLNKVRSLTFRRQIRKYLDESIVSSLFRYGWSKADQNDPDFVTFAETVDLNDPDNTDNIARYLRWNAIVNPLPKDTNSVVAYIDRLRELISNQDVVNAFATERVQSVIQSADPKMVEAFEYYKRNTTDEDAKAELQKLYDHYIGLTPGEQAVSFTMTDRDGNELALADLRGKAVYIDVWATWCGPCCAEIPYVEKLVEHFKDDGRIQFVSISLDEDRDSWIKKLDKDQPSWPQYICPDNFDSELAKNYNIDGIPRFLFFDKDGKVISLNAPRPSSAGIIDYISSHL